MRHRSFRLDAGAGASLQAEAFSCDVTDESAVQSTFKDISSHFQGPLRVSIFNANQPFIRKSALETSVAEYDAAWKVNGCVRLLSTEMVLMRATHTAPAPLCLPASRSRGCSRVKRTARRRRSFLPVPLRRCEEEPTLLPLRVFSPYAALLSLIGSIHRPSKFALRALSQVCVHLRCIDSRTIS